MSVFLDKAVRTCNVNTGEAERIRSDRFLSSDNMVCLVWNGLNNKGQIVHPDSEYTKSAGCNSALDRVLVEGQHRPQYFNYITLGAGGIQGDLYGRSMDDESVANSMLHKNEMDSRNDIAPNFGVQWGSQVESTSCSLNAYERGMEQVERQQRMAQMNMNLNTAGNNMRASGMM